MAAQNAENFEVTYLAPAVPGEARRAVALREAVTLGVRKGWDEGTVLNVAGQFDTFLEGPGDDE